MDTAYAHALQRTTQRSVKNLHNKDDHDRSARPQADIAAAPPLLHGLGGVEQEAQDGEGEDEVEQRDAHALGAAAGLGVVLVGPAERQHAAAADGDADGRQAARAARRGEVGVAERGAGRRHGVPHERRPAQVEQQLVLRRPPRRVRLGVDPHQRRPRHARREQAEQRYQRDVERPPASSAAAAACAVAAGAPLVALAAYVADAVAAAVWRWRRWRWWLLLL